MSDGQAAFGATTLTYREDLPAVFGPVMELLEPQLLQFMVEDMLPGQYVTEEQYAPGCAVDWYFGAMLGVDPKAQSYGVGGKIMTEIIKRAGDVPVAFHTQGSKNVSGVSAISGASALGPVPSCVGWARAAQARGAG